MPPHTLNPAWPAFESANARTYARAGARRLYVDQKWLSAEASLLLDYGPAILSKRVLELGAGSGRISSMLLHRSVEYYATDINSHMIKTLRTVHPAAMTCVADARKLSAFPEARFDTVIFSFNGLDSLPFPDRPLVIAEAYRVLHAGGVFIHSTHNVEFARSASYQPPLHDILTSPLSLLRRLWNRWSLYDHEYYSPDYAVVNDRSLDNGLLNVYVHPGVHRAHLEQTGFSVEALYDRSGRRFSPGEQPNDQWYYVVARK